MTRTGALVKRFVEALVIFFRVEAAVPALAKSASQAFDMASARFAFDAAFVSTTNRHGWALCAEGAHRAASKTSFSSSVETSRGEYFLTLLLF